MALIGSILFVASILWLLVSIAAWGLMLHHRITKGSFMAPGKIVRPIPVAATLVAILIIVIYLM